MTIARDDLLKRITARPDVFNGKPVTRNMRISVELVLSLLSQGAPYAVGVGVGTGTGVSAGATVAVGCGSAAALTVADGAGTAVGSTGFGVSAAGVACCSPPQATKTITADRNSSSTAAALTVPISLPHSNFMGPFSALDTVGSMARPVYLPGVRFDTASDSGRLRSVESRWKKTTARGILPEPHNTADEGNCPLEETLLPRVVKGWQTGPVVPRVTSGLPEDRLCEPHFQSSTTLSGLRVYV